MASPAATGSAARWRQGGHRAPGERTDTPHPEPHPEPHLEPDPEPPLEPGPEPRRTDDSEPRRTDDSEPPPAAPRARLPVGRRLRSLLAERLPLWVQLRCAVEPKTLAALAVVLLVAVGFAVHHFLSGRPESVSAPRAASAAVPLAGPSASPSPSARTLVVDVAGDVREPGVHRLPHGSRVADALKAAGGVRPGADPKELGGLNQARRLVDGEQILVGDAPAGAAAPAPAAGAAPGTGAGAAGPAGATAARISLSSATAGQLETLPGVGPVLARHIIDYRTRHGGFTSVDQLREVDGIGPATFADLEPRVGP